MRKGEEEKRRGNKKAPTDGVFIQCCEWLYVGCLLYMWQSKDASAASLKKNSTKLLVWQLSYATDTGNSGKEKLAFSFSRSPGLCTSHRLALRAAHLHQNKLNEVFQEKCTCCHINNPTALQLYARPRSKTDGAPRTAALAR